MLVWLLLSIYVVSSQIEQVVFEYSRSEADHEIALGEIDSSLEEAEPTLKEYDGSLSFPYGTNEDLVGESPPTKCDGQNGIFCKCGFQDVSWIYQQLEHNQDCYTLQGVCQHCGLQNRIREIGFDYKFLPPQHEDVYRLRILKEDEIWNPPRYNYQCKEGYVVTGVMSKYLRIDSLGGRDFYTLKIKCGKLKGEDDPNLRPSDWKTGKFPWLQTGEKPECADLDEKKCKEASECAWKSSSRKCENGSPSALQALISKAKSNPGVEQALESILEVSNLEKKADSTTPEKWNGKSSAESRRQLQEEPAASIDELQLGDDFHPMMKDILSEFSKFVQAAPSAPENHVGEEESPLLDPFLVQVLEQFGDSLMSDSKEDGQETVGSDDSQTLWGDSLDYYNLDSEETSVSSSEDDLSPIAVGDEFFDIDSDDIISGFLREEAEISRAFEPHSRHNLEEELEIGDSLTEIGKRNPRASSFAKRSSQYLSFGISAVLFDGVGELTNRIILWTRTHSYLEVLGVFVFGFLSFVLLWIVIAQLTRRSCNRAGFAYSSLKNRWDEDLMEF